MTNRYHEKKEKSNVNFISLSRLRCNEDRFFFVQKDAFRLSSSTDEICTLVWFRLITILIQSLRMYIRLDTPDRSLSGQSHVHLWFQFILAEGHRRIQMRIDRRETCANAQTVKPSVLRESTRAIRKKRGSSNILRALNVHCSLWQKFTRRDFVQRVMYNYTEFEPRDDPETSNLEFWMIQSRMNTGFEHNFAGKSFHRG